MAKVSKVELLKRKPSWNDQIRIDPIELTVCWFSLIWLQVKVKVSNTLRQKSTWLHVNVCRASSALRWWCHAEKSRRRSERWPRAVAEDHGGTPGAGIPAERCGVWPDDHDQRGARRGRCPVCCCRCGGSGEEAGRSAQPAGEAAELQRAERPQERAVPPLPELSLQRAGEATGMGFRLPRLCVSRLYFAWYACVFFYGYGFTYS